MFYEAPLYRLGGHLHVLPQEYWLPASSLADCLQRAAAGCPVVEIYTDQLPAPLRSRPRRVLRFFRSFDPEGGGWHYFGLYEEPVETP